jgi:hypothetical protein
VSAQTRPQRSKGGAGSPLAPDPQPPLGGEGSAQKNTSKHNMSYHKKRGCPKSLDSLFFRYFFDLLFFIFP